MRLSGILRSLQTSQYFLCSVYLVIDSINGFMSFSGSTNSNHLNANRGVGSEAPF